MPKAPSGELSDFAQTVAGWRTRLGWHDLPEHARVPGREREEVRQDDIARAACVSLSTYVRLERHRGGLINIQATVLDAVAKALLLNDFQRGILHLGALGHQPTGSWAQDAHQISDEMIQIVRTAPQPAYISNLGWDVVAYNDRLADVMPWLTHDGANVMYTTFLDETAREHLVDFETVWAPPMVYAMRVALAHHPDDQRLLEVTGRVRSESALAAELWRMALDIDGHTMGARRTTVVHDVPRTFTITAMGRYATPGARVIYLVPVE